jgi:Ca-activated chloride channel family protein
MTDGYIGNETDIIGAVHDRIGAARIFSFGVGSSVNRYLLERMAKEGRGAVAYLGPQDSADSIMSDFFARISRPAMTDVEIDWGSMVVSDVYPPKLPDLFAGRAVVVAGKYAGTASELEVNGRRGNADANFVVNTDASADPRPAIAKLWARLRIADLKDRQAWENDPYGELATAIRVTALEHQLVSDYTSFVAVDASHRTDGDYGVTVPQAVPVPDGVRYETTVEQR